LDASHGIRIKGRDGGRVTQIFTPARPQHHRDQHHGDNREHAKVAVGAPHRRRRRQRIAMPIRISRMGNAIR
jgi:hypothetical protein